MKNEFHKENRLVRVSFTGGIIGLLAGSYLGRLQKVISAQNGEGWNLAEVMPDNRNLLVWIIRLILLFLTLGFWTLSTGYILVFERVLNSEVQSQNKDFLPQSGRREPSVTSMTKSRI